MLKAEGAPKATDTPEAAGTPKATDTPEAAGTPEATDTPEAVDMPKATDTLKAADTPKAKDAPKAAAHRVRRTKAAVRRRARCAKKRFLGNPAGQGDFAVRSGPDGDIVRRTADKV